MGKSKRARSDDDHSTDSTSSSSGSDSDAARRHKRRNKSKDKKHKKSKSKQKHRRGEQGKDKDDLVAQAKRFLKQQLSGGTAAPCHAELKVEGGALAVQAAAASLGPSHKVQDPITEDDYFSKSAEFSAWLLEECRLYAADLPTEQARELFNGFVQVWNAGRLAAQYYAGMVAAPRKRTQHAWAFKGAAGASAGGSGGGSSKGVAAYLQDQKDKLGADHLAARGRSRTAARELLDEVAPAATGRDKQVEDRKARRELARNQDDDTFGGWVPGGGSGDLMGGGDSLAEARAREAKRAAAAQLRVAARTESVAVRAAAYQAREEDKLAGLRALLTQGPITIAKRQ